jgi:peroxin-12
MLLVERHFLRTYGGGFTENFYGLKRERVLRVRGGEIPRAQVGAADQVRESLKLRESDIWRNLAVLVGLPYLKRKLDEGYDIHAAHANALGPGFRSRDEQLSPDASIRERLRFYYKWFLRNVYPSLNAAYYFSLLAFNLAYLFDGSKYHSPFLWLIGTRMRRLGQADHKAIALATQPTPAASAGGRPGEGGSILHPRNMARAVYPAFTTSLRLLLPTSIFALKFLEWWHASDFARQLSKKAAEGLELPPPVVSGLLQLSPKGTSKKQSAAANTKTSEKPSSDEKKPSDSSEQPADLRTPPISSTSFLPILTVPYPPTSDSGDSSSLCPICTSPITTATATPTGFVFCYVCIHRWVEGDHERQAAFMEGGGGEAGWGSEEGSRVGRWESGKGRCAVTGRRLLGGTESLRRLIV